MTKPIKSTSKRLYKTTYENRTSIAKAIKSNPGLTAPDYAYLVDTNVHAVHNFLVYDTRGQKLAKAKKVAKTPLGQPPRWYKAGMPVREITHMAFGDTLLVPTGADPFVVDGANKFRAAVQKVAGFAHNPRNRRRFSDMVNAFDTMMGRVVEQDKLIGEQTVLIDELADNLQRSSSLMSRAKQHLISR